MSTASDDEVLVLDDEAVARTLLSRVVERCGLKAVQAASVAEARALLGRPFVCALVDKNLPDGSGLDFMEALQAQAPGTPAILVSAFLDVTSAVAAVRAGAVDILTKPPEVPALRALLEGLRAKARVEASRAAAMATLLAEVERARALVSALGPGGQPALEALDAAMAAAAAAGFRGR